MCCTDISDLQNVLPFPQDTVTHFFWSIVHETVQLNVTQQGSLEAGGPGSCPSRTHELNTGEMCAMDGSTDAALLLVSHQGREGLSGFSERDKET